MIPVRRLERPLKTSRCRREEGEKRGRSYALPEKLSPWQSLLLHSALCRALKRSLSTCAIPRAHLLLFLSLMKIRRHKIRMSRGMRKVGEATYQAPGLSGAMESRHAFPAANSLPLL